MRKSTDLSSVLQTRGFWLHRRIGDLLGIGFLGQCLVITTICALAMLLTSTVDHSLLLPGRDVGFLEHPAIWAFLIFQTALPLSLARSLRKLEDATLKNGEISSEGKQDSVLIMPAVQRFLDLDDWESQLAATFIYCAGVAALALNSYQNQFPQIIVPYDFWDSTTFMWGYAITRVYKFYLFVVLLPYLAMIHVGILLATLRFVRQVRIAGELKLLPFHQDGLGGFGFVAAMVSKPIILTLAIGALATAGAFVVHRAANITPVVGLVMLLTWALLTYVAPILYLRTDIVALKREMIKKLRSVQQSDYSKVFADEAAEAEVLKKEKDALEYFDKVCARVEAIPNYPHWKRLIGFAGLLVTPPLFSLILNVLIGLFPTLGRVLGKP